MRRTRDWETETRIGNCSNRHQGGYKKVLAVCSAGMLRSPTVAWVLGQEPYGYNCRAAGFVTDYALVKVDDVLLSWADEVVCADFEHKLYVQDQFKRLGLDKPVVDLDLPDIYEYRDPELVKLIKERYDAYLNPGTDGRSIQQV